MERLKLIEVLALLDNLEEPGEYHHMIPVTK